eukprot:scpid14096/ scgid6452/ 
MTESQDLKCGVPIRCYAIRGLAITAAIEHRHRGQAMCQQPDERRDYFAGKHEKQHRLLRSVTSCSECRSPHTARRALSFREMNEISCLTGTFTSTSSKITNIHQILSFSAVSYLKE